MEQLQQTLHYTFQTLDLLTQALTHSSFSKENYERLEFLGDSVLSFIIAEAFYLKTKFDEGYLSRARANLVSASHLSSVFDKLDIDKYALVGKSFVRPLSASVKSDIIEAIIGAIYLDGGMAVVKKFVLTTLEVSKYFGSAPTDSKTKLQEYLQKNGKVKLGYMQNKPVSKTSNHFEMNVSVFGKVFASGSATSKRDAEQIAASKALIKIKRLQKKATAVGVSLEQYIQNNSNNNQPSTAASVPNNHQAAATSKPTDNPTVSNQNQSKPNNQTTANQNQNKSNNQTTAKSKQNNKQSSANNKKS